VNGARDHVFANPRFAAEQDGNIDVGNFVDALANRVKCRTTANQTVTPLSRSGAPSVEEQDDSLRQGERNPALKLSDGQRDRIG